MPAPLIKVKLVLLSIPTLITGCMPGPSANRDQITSLQRHTYPAVLRDNDSELSALVTPSFLPREGAEIIYVHGTPGSATAYADYLLHDAELGRSSVAIDRPGFGDSSSTGAVTSFELQARAIEPLLPPVGSARKAILVGHSLGGPIVAAAATLYKSQVGAVIIVAGSLDPDLEKPRWFNHAGDFVLTKPFLPADLRVSNEEILDAPRQTRWLDVLLRSNWPDPSVPIFVVHGTKDTLVPYANVDYMQRVFESIELATIDDEGHFILWSHDGVIREAIDSALHQMQSGLH